jgi:hypothetical protein
MATTLSTKVSLSVEGTLTKAMSISTSVAANPKATVSETLANGTSTDQADKMYFVSGSIAASGTVDRDLAGTLEDAFGDACVFVKIKAIILKNTSDEQDPETDAEIQIGGGTGGDGTNAFDTWITSTAADGSEAVKVPAGGAVALFAPAAGYAVTAATADILHIVNNDAVDAATYELIVIGTSA